MPSQARLDAPGVLHHVVIRGIERGSIVHTCKKTLGTLVQREIKTDIKLDMGKEKSKLGAILRQAKWCGSWDVRRRRWRGFRG